MMYNGSRSLPAEILDVLDEPFCTVSDEKWNRFVRCVMKAYDFKVLLEPDQEAGGYVVSCPALPGCHTQGDTIDEALENIEEAILLCLEDMMAQHQPIPDMSRTLISSVAITV